MREEWKHSLAERQRQSARVPFMRAIRYEASEALPTDEYQHEPYTPARQGEALCINISSGGVLLMMDWDPQLERIIRLDVPTPVSPVRTPTLTQVRWKRKAPSGEKNGRYFVGLKFIV